MSKSFILLTDCCHYHSFVDWDMLMRHFGHGVGHLQYKRQQTEPDGKIAEVESSDSDMVDIEEDKQDGNDDVDMGTSLEDDGVGNSDVDDDDGGSEDNNDGGSDSEADACHSIHDRDSDGSDSMEVRYGSF